MSCNGERRGAKPVCAAVVLKREKKEQSPWWVGDRETGTVNENELAAREG